MFSGLISRESQISCQFPVRKIRILLIFHGLMISGKNINKNNLLGNVVNYDAV